MRYVIEHKNSLKDEVTRRIEIIDTKTNWPQALHFHAVSGSINLVLNGSPNELIPGVYPSTFKVTMLVKGPLAGLWEYLRDSTEKDWILRSYCNDELEFVGYLLPDECSMEDVSQPYGLELTATDGFHLLQDVEFTTLFGEREYRTCWLRSVSDDSAYTESLLDECVAGEQGWTMLEHFAHTIYPDPLSNEIVGSETYTAYAREFIISAEEPVGTGWTNVGNNKWVRPLEVLDTVEEWDFIEGSYRLTSLMAEDAEFESLNSILRRAFEMCDLDDYMDSGYYEVLSDIRHDGMEDMSGDPTQYIGIPRDALKGKKWQSILNEICRLHGFRIYQARGRFRVEQLTARTPPPSVLEWWVYGADGTLQGKESNNEYLHLEIPRNIVGAGGRWTFQPALKKITITLDELGENWLEQTYWQTPDQMGERYIGTIAKEEANMSIEVRLRNRSITKFDYETMQLYTNPNGNLVTFIDLFTGHMVEFTIQMRAVSRETDTVYYYKVTDPILLGSYPYETATIVAATTTTPGVYPITVRSKVFVHSGMTVAEACTRIRDLFLNLHAFVPGGVGDQFDLYVSWHFTSYWLPDGLPSVFKDDPTKVSFFGQSFENSMAIKTNTDQKNVRVERKYQVVNTTRNTKTIEYEANYGDLLYHKKGLWIKNGIGKWVKAGGFWGRGAGPYEKEFLLLAAEEAMSLRMAPKDVYNGTIYTEQFTMGHILRRNFRYYLPMRVTYSTEMDTLTGEFIEIGIVPPPEGDVIGIDYPPLQNDDLPWGGSVGDVGEDGGLVLYFVTDEVLTSGNAYDESDIINTLGAYAATGDLLRIVDQSAGVEQVVKLTAGVAPGDTVMHFESVMFSHTFPSGSLIIMQTEGEIAPPLTSEGYQYSDKKYVGDYHVFPDTYVLPDPDQTSQQWIQTNINVYKNGNKMTFDQDGNFGDIWKINLGLNRIEFLIGFDEDHLEIDAKPK